MLKSESTTQINLNNTLLSNEELLTLTSTGGTLQTFDISNDGRGGEIQTWKTHTANLKYSLNVMGAYAGTGAQREKENPQPTGAIENINYYILHLPPGTAGATPKNRFVSNDGGIYEIQSVDPPINVEVIRRCTVIQVS